MLDSLSFLHSSPPVFSSMNTVNPSFLFNFDNIEKIRSASIQNQTTLSKFLEKFSARVQIRTSRSTFLFYFKQLLIN